MHVSLLTLLLAATVAQPAEGEALRHDTRGRPVIQVTLNGRGPFDMVVDTAAQASLIVAETAAYLQLPERAERIQVRGATGTEDSAQYDVARLAGAALDRTDVVLIALPNAGSTDARGILGMDLFPASKLGFDRTGGRFTVEPSSPPAAGYVALSGGLTESGFVHVPVVVDGVTVTATIDTGAAITVANLATLRALGWEEDDPRLTNRGAITGASAIGQAVSSGVMARVRIGPATLSEVPLFFSGDGGSEPTLLLGSDILNLLNAYSVDLRRGELHIRLPDRPAG